MNVPNIISDQPTSPGYTFSMKRRGYLLHFALRLIHTGDPTLQLAGFALQGIAHNIEDDTEFSSARTPERKLHSMGDIYSTDKEDAIYSLRRKLRAECRDVRQTALCASCEVRPICERDDKVEMGTER